MTRASGQVSGVSAPQAHVAAPEPWAAGERELRAAGGALGATANGAGVGGRGAKAPGVRGQEAVGTDQAKCEALRRDLHRCQICSTVFTDTV